MTDCPWSLGHTRLRPGRSWAHPNFGEQRLGYRGFSPNRGATSILFYNALFHGVLLPQHNCTQTARTYPNRSIKDNCALMLSNRYNTVISLSAPHAHVIYVPLYILGVPWGGCITVGSASRERVPPKAEINIYMLQRPEILAAGQTFCFLLLSTFYLPRRRRSAKFQAKRDTPRPCDPACS